MCPTDLIFKDILPSLKESRLKGFCIVYRSKSDCQRLKQKKVILVLTLTNYLLLGLVLFTQGISKVSLSFPNPRLNKKKRGKLLGGAFSLLAWIKIKRVKVNDKGGILPYALIKRKGGHFYLLGPTVGFEVHPRQNGVVSTHLG